MSPTDHSTAWENPATRRAWTLHMMMTVGRFIGWIAVWAGVLYLIVATPTSIGWVFLPVLLYATFRAFLQVGYFVWSMNMPHILQQYPWQFLVDVPRGRNKHPQADDDEMWLEIPNPEKTDERVPLLFLASMRTFWWMRRFGTTRTKPELKAQIEPLWFAGDPRFYAVIAAPGRRGETPKRLHFLYQRPARGRGGIMPVDWNASAAALERARRAGARVPDATPPQSRTY